MWAFGKNQHGTATGQEDFTFLGKDVVFKGVLTLQGSVRVDGQFEGELHSTGTVTVGELAIVRGNIKARVLITSGKIKGDITASEKVMIMSPGMLIGDVRTPSISIEGGAHFHGLSNMGADTWVEGHNAADERIRDLAAHRGRLRAPDY